MKRAISEIELIKQNTDNSINVLLHLEKIFVKSLTNDDLTPGEREAKRESLIEIQLKLNEAVETKKELSEALQFIKCKFNIHESKKLS